MLAPTLPNPDYAYPLPCFPTLSDTAEVSVLGTKVRLAFDAPDQVRILRAELLGGQDRPVPDPDLKGKPPEWEDGTPDLAESR